ncbi:sensor histidine kinase [Niabella hibiscisoli]|uniref:sensor histidine kinase n=1 Tax=Niabella hibiscisoli TaxID=1825928 RepID=UPI001F0E7F7C|nr:histidine kinase [Niabella hibiscisoli]MCH5720759.1 histidine kinase [Niabella hibiscisoli]
MPDDLHVHILMASFVLVLLLLFAVAGSTYLLRRLRAKDAEQMKAVLLAEEKERNLIAREIHDNLGPLLSIAQLQLDYLREEPTVSNLHKLAPHLHQQLSTAVNLSRNISHELSPFIDDQKDLKDILQAYIGNINASRQLQVTLQWNSLVDLQGGPAISLFRILQELLQNTIRHARASKAGIDIRSGLDYLTVVYTDNGIGLNLLLLGKGLGTQNITSRVQSLRGRISWSDKKKLPGSPGLHIALQLPLQQFEGAVKLPDENP